LASLGGTGGGKGVAGASVAYGLRALQLELGCSCMALTLAWSLLGGLA
jgi:hypothetical protein